MNRPVAPFKAYDGSDLPATSYDIRPLDVTDEEENFLHWQGLQFFPLGAGLIRDAWQRGGTGKYYPGHILAARAALLEAKTRNTPTLYVVPMWEVEDWEAKLMAERKDQAEHVARSKAAAVFGGQ